MINLLPEENRRSIKTEYLRRVLVVAGIFTFLSVSVGIILLYPIFYSLSTHKQLFQNELKTSKELYAKEDRVVVISYITEMKTKMAILTEGYEKARQKSEAVRKVLSKKNENIFIEGISFVDTRLVIVGISKTRDSLLSFVDLLKEEGSFEKIDSPASNLLKGEDLEFTININL